MTIKVTQHIDLLPVYICPTCLRLTPFQAGEHWQVCEEQHFSEVRRLTFANGAGLAKLCFRLRNLLPNEQSRATFFGIVSEKEWLARSIRSLGKRMLVDNS